MNKTFYLSGHPAHISASIGVAITDRPSYDEKQLMRQADTAMYQAKSRGRNNVVLYQDPADKFHDWAI